jgi:hypothetical protein
MKISGSKIISRGTSFASGGKKIALYKKSSKTGYSCGCI